jgi:endonuclease YncB( thermonuclease family)
MQAVRAVLLLVLILFGGTAFAEPIQSSAIEVVTGDMIKVKGKNINLMGYNAPRPGWRAGCTKERQGGEKAVARLKQLTSTDNLDLQTVACPCSKRTTGTIACNMGRACAVLRVGGQDVAELMVKEKLARAHVCGERRCPRLKGWCDF